MNRTRDYYRKQRNRQIRRKVNILRKLGGDEYVQAWTHGSSGRLAKGKTHCSCFLCRRKSNDAPLRSERAAYTAAEEQIKEMWV